MSKCNSLHHRLVQVCAKLRTMRDSCRGIFRTQQYPQCLSWFEGAAAICQEAIDGINELLASTLLSNKEKSE